MPPTQLVPDVHNPDPEHRLSRGSLWRQIALATAALLLGVTSCVYAGFRMFSNFPAYDDQGYMMMTVKHLCDGHALYREVKTVYGPFYYLCTWAVHGLAGLPITNETTRLLSVGIWLAISGVVAFTVFRMTRLVTLAAVAYVLTIYLLRVFSGEPGHPQELCVLLVALCVAAAASGRRPMALPFVAGATAAALAATKVNVGVFFFLSVVLAACAGNGSGWLRAALRGLAATGAMLLPFVIARSQLGDPQVFSFAALVSLSVVPLLRVSRLTERQLTWGDPARFLAGFIVVALVSAGFALLHGSTVASLLDGLLVAPMRLAANVGHYPPPISLWAIPVSIISILVVFFFDPRSRWAARFGLSRYAGLFAVLKLAYGLWLLSQFTLGDPWKVMSFGPSFLWLALIRYPDESRGPTPDAPRLMLCFLAALQPFQAYPIPGSQAYVGSFLMVIVASVCVGDVLSWGRRRWAGLRSVTLLSAALPLLVGAVLVGAWSRRAVRAAADYRKGTAIDAPGTGWIRIDAGRVETFRWLMASIQAGEDTFFCTMGFNSLHFWTGRDPVSRVVVGNSLDIFSAEQQQTMVAALERHPRAIVIDHTSHFSSPGSARPVNLLRRFIAENYVTYDQANGFELKHLRGQAAPPLQPRPVSP